MQFLESWAGELVFNFRKEQVLKVSEQRADKIKTSLYQSFGIEGDYNLAATLETIKVQGIPFRGKGAWMGYFCENEIELRNDKKL